MNISSDTLALIIGIVFGIVASIPTSLVIVAATGSRRKSNRELESSYWQREAMGHPVPPIEAQYREVTDPGQRAVMRIIE